MRDEDQRSAALELLSATTCWCRRPKNSGHVVCIRCWSKLPREVRDGLYLKSGEGFEESVDRARLILDKGYRKRQTTEMLFQDFVRRGMAAQKGVNAAIAAARRQCLPRRQR